MTDQLYFYDTEDKVLVGEMYTSWDDVTNEYFNDSDKRDLVVLSFYEGKVDEVCGFCIEAVDEEVQRIHADEEDFVSELLDKT